MKNITRLIITILILTITLGLTAFLITKGQRECAHMDLNKDEICDICQKESSFGDGVNADEINKGNKNQDGLNKEESNGLNFNAQIKEKLEIKSVETTSEDNTKIKISGKMPKEAKTNFEGVAKTDAIDLAKKYVEVETQDVVAAYDISLNNKNTKYQPKEYDEKVEIEISNVEIDLNKDYAMLHIIDDENYEILPVEKIGSNKISFKTSSFSTYILITVENHSVTFEGSNYTVLDMDGIQIEDGAEVTNGTNFNFKIVPATNYVITNVTCVNSSAQNVAKVTGNPKEKIVEIASVTDALTITVTTVLESSINNYKVGDNYYSNLQSAISAASDGATIVVMRDVTDTSTATVSKNLILDTNGCYLTKNSTGITVSSGKTLSVIGNGRITGGASATIVNNGTFELTDAFIRNWTDNSEYMAINNAGILNINSGTVSGIRCAVKNSKTINLKGGSIQAGEVSANSYNNSGTVCAIISSGGDINLTGGTIFAKNAGANQQARGCEITGGNITIENANIIVESSYFAVGVNYYSSTSGAVGKLQFNSGTVEVKSSDTAFGLSVNSASSINVPIKVSGGTVIAEDKTKGWGIRSLTNTGTVEILGGTITGSHYGIYLDSKPSSIIIGDNNADLNKTNPVISGGTHGIYSSKAVTFNNGIIKGTNAIPYSGTITTSRSGYEVEVKEPAEGVADGLYSAYLVNAAHKMFVTEWTIPVNADGAGLGTTIKLPITAHANNSYRVDWGDGSEIQTFDSTADFPNHNYKNTEKTIYTIKITGTVENFGFFGTSYPTENNTYSNYYSFTQYLTNLVAWGELDSTQYSFYYCGNLTGSIPTPTANTFKNVTDMSLLFSNTGISQIPEDLFSNCSNVTNMSGTFSSTKITEIPATLFSNCTNVTNFADVFSSCSKITTIPENLFINNKKVIDFSRAFAYSRNNECFWKNF